MNTNMNTPLEKMTSQELERSYWETFDVLRLTPQWRAWKAVEDEKTRREKLAQAEPLREQLRAEILAEIKAGWKGDERLPEPDAGR